MAALQELEYCRDAHGPEERYRRVKIISREGEDQIYNDANRLKLTKIFPTTEEQNYIATRKHIQDLFPMTQTRATGPEAGDTPWECTQRTMRFFTDLARERARNDRFACPVQLEQARPVIQTSQNSGEENKRVNDAILARLKSQHYFVKGNYDYTRIPCIASPVPTVCPTTFAVSTLLNKDVGRYEYTGKPSADMSFPSDPRLKNFYPPIQMKVCDNDNAIISVNNSGPTRIYFAQPGDQCKKIETTDQTWRVMSLLRGTSPTTSPRDVLHKEYQPMSYIDRNVSSVISPSSTPTKLYPPPYVTTTEGEFMNRAFPCDFEKKFSPQLQIGTKTLDSPVEFSTATSLTYPIAVRQTRAGNFEKAMFTNNSDQVIYSTSPQGTRLIGMQSTESINDNSRSHPIANQPITEKSKYQHIEKILNGTSFDKSGLLFEKTGHDAQIARMNALPADIHSEVEFRKRFVNLPQ